MKSQVLSKFKNADIRNFILTFSTEKSVRRSQSYEFRVLEFLNSTDIFGELSFLEGFWNL